MVNVLPVPALASRTVTPCGSGPQTSNGLMSVMSVTARRPPRVRARRPTGAGRSGRSGSSRCRPSRRPARRCCGGSAVSSSKLRMPPRTSWCSRSASSLGKLQPDSHALRPALSASRAGERGCGVGGRGHAGERERLAHAAVVEVDEGRELLERQLLARGRVVRERREPGDRDRRAVRRAGPRLPDRGRRERALGVRRGQRQPADVGREPVAGVDPRVGDGPQHVAVDAGDRPAERAPVIERDLDVDRRRLGAFVELRVRGRRDVRDDRAHLGDHGVGELARRQRPARDLGGDARLDARAREDAVEQPLPDTPALERVELDRQRVFDLVGVVPDADAEPLAQERAGRDARRSARGPRAPRAARSPPAAGRRGRAEARRASVVSARAPLSVTESKLHARSGTSSPTMKFFGSNGCSGCLISTRSRAGPSSVRTVRSITSSSSPTGTAGGLARFVRSSLPV